MSVNFSDADDSTPLHTFAQLGHLEATNVLVGAALNYSNRCGNTALMLAAYCRELEIFHYFTKISPLINIQGAIKSTALHLADDSGSVGIIKLLLDKETSVNLINTDDSFFCVCVSVQFSQLKATKILVEEGAGIINTNKYGFTPLMLGAYSGKLVVFHYLTEMALVLIYLSLTASLFFTWLFLFITLKTALFFTSFHPRILWTISIQSYTN